MKKLFALLTATLLAFTATNAKADKVSVSVEGGYTETLFDHGVARLDEAWYTKLNLFSPAENNGIPVDLFGSGLWSPDNTIWSVGAGRSLYFEGSDKWGLRFELEGATQQTSIANLRDTAQVSGKVGFLNPYFSPFVRYTTDWSTEQNGFEFGLTKNHQWGHLNFVPGLSYFLFEDYDAFQLNASFAFTKWRQVTPFVKVAWVDNDFEVTRYNWATFEASGDTAVTAGVSINF